MHKVFLILFAVLGTSSLTAQDTISTGQASKSLAKNFYLSLGATFNNGYNINEKLNASNWPGIKYTIPEVGIGYSISGRKFITDLELSVGYINSKAGYSNRSSIVGLALKVRGQYVPVRTDSFYLGVGGDLSYLTNTVNLYNNNVININDLQAGYSGHISLYNEWLCIGPSVALGLFQTYDIPIRVNMGYEWMATKGNWTSNFSEVTNSINESGLSRFYAKVTFIL